MDETTVAVVADAARAHLFRVEVATGTWTPLERIEHPEGRLHDGDLRNPTRVENAGTRSRPVPESGPHGRHALEARRFADWLVADLTRRLDAREFHRLVVVAPAEMMGLLRQAYPHRLGAAVVEELTRDLTHLPAEALADRVDVPHA